MQNKYYFFIKEDDSCTASDIQGLRSSTLKVLVYFTEFCHSRGLPCIVTNLITKFPESTSNTHPEGRAFDASLKSFTNKDISEMKKFMVTKCGKLGAYGKDMERRLIVVHDSGRGKHVHFQVAR